MAQDWERARPCWIPALLGTSYEMTEFSLWKVEKNAFLQDWYARVGALKTHSIHDGNYYYYDYFKNTKSSSLFVGILYGGVIILIVSTETKASAHTILSFGLWLVWQTLVPGPQNLFLLNSNWCSKIFTPCVKHKMLFRFWVLQIYIRWNEISIIYNKFYCSQKG